MKTTAAKKDITEVIINLCDYHSKLFLNALDGISDRNAQNRLGTHETELRKTAYREKINRI